MEIIGSKPSQPCPTSINEKLDTLNKFCRVCFEGEISNNPLTSSCKCDGSVKYIHEECLKKWILSQVQDPRTFKCDLCKNPVNMQIESKLVLSFSQLKYEFLGILISPLLFIIDTCFLYLSINFLIRSTFDPAVPASVKFLSVIIFLNSIIFDFALVIMFYKSIKNGCFGTKILSWTILSNLENSDLEFTILEQVLQNNRESIEKSQENQIGFGNTDETLDSENCVKNRDRIESTSSDVVFPPRDEDLGEIKGEI